MRGFTGRPIAITQPLIETLLVKSFLTQDTSEFDQFPVKAGLQGCALEHRADVSDLDTHAGETVNRVPAFKRELTN